jgi:hypothetical protein
MAEQLIAAFAAANLLVRWCIGLRDGRLPFGD